MASFATSAVAKLAIVFVKILTHIHRNIQTGHSQIIVVRYSQVKVDMIDVESLKQRVVYVNVCFYYSATEPPE